jgi:hypothetical protein
MSLSIPPTASYVVGCFSTSPISLPTLIGLKTGPLMKFLQGEQTKGCLVRCRVEGHSVER